MDQWEILANMEKVRDANPNYINDIKKFNSKFFSKIKKLGLEYEYNPIYRVDVYTSGRVCETHNYNISFNLGAVPYSILNTLLGKKSGSNVYLGVKSDNEKYPLKDFEFAINVSNPVLSSEITQLTLEDNFYEKAIEFLVLHFKAIKEFYDDDEDVTFKNPSIKKVAIKILTTKRLSNKDYKNIGDIILSNNTDFKFILELKKENPSLYKKLVLVNNKFVIGSEMSELGF